MTYRILSLDGGGTWAMLQAMALRDLYGDVPGREILANFDLAVANSGGSIVLGGLIENMTPSEVVDLFNNQEKRQQIFVKVPLVESLLAHIPIFPKYSAADKLIGLRNAFGSGGDQFLADLPGSPAWPDGPNGNPTKILIVGFDYDALRATFFRSYDTVQGAKANQVPLVDAVHASSNAPVIFFDAPAVFDDHRYWDGAMGGYNNPLMAGVVDLLAEAAPAGEVIALSIGTGTIKLIPPGAPGLADANLRQQPAVQSVIADVGKAAGCINDDPPDSASYAAHVILSTARGIDLTKTGPVVRLSPVVQPVLENDVWTVPAGISPTQFDGLKNLAMDAVEQDQVDMITALGFGWLNDGVPNQPIRMASDTLACELGDANYSAGKARWEALTAPAA